MKATRTIRLDPSDTFVFARAAEPGEWAVPGGFMFHGADPAAMQGKERAAFRAGFLGIDSFGFSTLVTIVEVNAAERDAAVETLAARLVAHLGAPSLDVARAAAREEIEFSLSLCHDPVGSLLALHRTMEEGDIREQFRVLKDAVKNEGADRLHSHARAFTIVESDEDEVEERVDLLGLGGLKS